MQLRILLALIISFNVGPAFAKCDVLSWQFGMSPEEVAAIADCGPYKSFNNGDLETYNGVFNGKKENFQFFFHDEKLRRIGVYLYEGQDPAAGAKIWLELYASLAKLFGDIETPENVAPTSKETSDAFMETALKTVQNLGKTQMAPAAQPKDAFAFSSFMRNEVEGESYYYIVLYFDSFP
ncbi:hypothetical protein CSC70_13350 [Pseudoxanthomonas kalamensis DSM 18571]|uniref:hypothetical protein n=1 Tax=Pseudoxanthomonas kalamensis TaxID=289483 RepID=UPI001390D6C0|nr:hypothetical protein [Pseudoxanthomonas kalamensis]KAF1707938.1 hypothetical protein CSC70_13350 [Pseudoxanthomonas kalamensis DSM 18571]